MDFDEYPVQYEEEACSCYNMTRICLPCHLDLLRKVDKFNSNYFN
jgi:hypothetical protein